MARQPGPEVIDEARSLRTELQKKIKFIQSLTAERNMYMSENVQARQRMDAMSEELGEARKQTMEISKKFKKLKEQMQQQRTTAQTPAPRHADASSTTTISLLPSAMSFTSKPKFVGGGFNLSSSIA